MSVDDRHSSPYWRKTLGLSVAMLIAWLVPTVGVGLFGRDMDFQFFGWPFGVWATAQLALVLYCVIVWIYAWAMDRLDQAHDDQRGD